MESKTLLGSINCLAGILSWLPYHVGTLWHDDFDTERVGTFLCSSSRSELPPAFLGSRAFFILFLPSIAPKSPLSFLFPFYSLSSFCSLLSFLLITSVPINITINFSLSSNSIYSPGHSTHTLSVISFSYRFFLISASSDPTTLVGRVGRYC